MAYLTIASLEERFGNVDVRHYQSYSVLDEAKETTRKLEAKYDSTLEKNGLYNFVCCVVVYLIFAFTEIYGMSSSFSEANEIVKKIFTQNGALFIDPVSLLFGLLSTLLLFVKDFKDEYSLSINFVHSKYFVIRYFSIVVLVAYILLFGVLNGGQFIYFQF